MRNSWSTRDVSGGGELVGEGVEVRVVRVHHRVHFAEGEELVAPLVAEELVHRIGPVDPAPGDVPVPQAAAAAVEGGIDPVAHLLADLVGRAGAVRLHDIGETDADRARS